MRKGKKMRRNLTIAIIVMFIVLGFAFLSTNLDISGFYGIRSMKWDIHFENVIVSDNSVTANEPTLSNSNTELSYTVTLDAPTDYYEFTVDAKNNGSMDAIVSNIENNVYDATGTTKITMPEYLEYSVTNSDGSRLTIGQSLPRKSKKTYKIKVNVKSGLTFSELPGENTSVRFRLKIEYSQKKAGMEEAYAYYDGDATLDDAIPTLFRYKITDSTNKKAKITYINGDYKSSKGDTLYNCFYSGGDCSSSASDFDGIDDLVIPVKVKLNDSCTDDYCLYDGNGSEYTITSAEIDKYYCDDDDNGYQFEKVDRLYTRIIMPNTLISSKLSGNYTSLQKIKLSKNLTSLPAIVIDGSSSSLSIPEIKVPRGVTTLNYASLTNYNYEEYSSFSIVGRDYNTTTWDSYSEDGFILYIPSSVTTIENDSITFEGVEKIYVENKSVKNLVISEIEHYCDDPTYYNFYSSDDSDNADKCKNYNTAKVVVDQFKFNY